MEEDKVGESIDIGFFFFLFGFKEEIRYGDMIRIGERGGDIWVIYSIWNIVFCGRWYYGRGVSLEREVGVEGFKKRFLWLVMEESVIIYIF